MTDPFNPDPIIPEPAHAPTTQGVRQGWNQRSRKSPGRAAAAPRLGQIDEHGGMAPDVPARVHHRPVQRVLNFAFPPTLHSSRHPPPYTEYNDVTGPNGEKFSDLRSNRYSPQRGGWFRFCIIALVAVVIIIALAVGLGVGLTHRKSSPSNSSTFPNNTSPGNPDLPFPLGSYAFTAALFTVSTACTANPSTWRCYPYETYNESSAGAVTTFNWIISSPEDGNNQSDTTFLISSSNNPFALEFTNATLLLTDADTEQEAFTFDVGMQKIVVPSSPISSDDAQTQCYYNNTQFTAKLYTKMPKTYPAGSSSNTTSSTTNSGNYGNWPYAVEVSQIIGGGSGVPDCYKISNGVIGEHVSVGATESSSDECQCLYQNYGL